MSKKKRRQLFVDKHVQGGLMLRAVLYWFFCLISVTAMVMCWAIFTGPPRPAGELLLHLWQTYAPALVASLLLVPIVVVDAVRFSNRFAGPTLRLRRAMRDLAEGRPVGPVRFRKNDFWHDMAAEFNRLREEVERQRAGNRPAESAAEDAAEFATDDATTSGV